MPNEPKREHTKQETMEDKYKNICRFLTFVLRHKPYVAHVKLDEYGFTDLGKILFSIEKRFKLKLNENELNKTIGKYAKNFFEIRNKKIRAKFGHTIILNLNVPDGFEITKDIPHALYACVDRNEMFTVSKCGLQSSIVIDGLVSDKNNLNINSNLIVYINSEKAIKNSVEFFFNKNTEKYFCKFIPANFLRIEL